MLKHPYFMKNQRKIALEIFSAYINENKDYEVLLEKYRKDLNSQEYGFVKTVVLGTIRYLIQIDYLIRKMSTTKFSKIDPNILNILRISLYQLIYMRHVPESAVVNEAVNLSKLNKNKSLSSFVNGILRNFIRNKEKLLIINEKDEKKALSIYYSFPMWIIDEIEKAYGKDLEKILKKFNEEPKFVLRYNKTKIERQKFIDLLLSENYDFKSTKNSPEGFVIENPKGIFESDLYREGLFYVQSESSQMVGHLANPRKNMSILDLCSAPGGKITHIYELIKGNGNFVACDVSEEKLNIIKENINRLDEREIELVKNDGTVYNEKFKDGFDIVLIDAPCSALGLIAKFPEIKNKKSPEDLKALSGVQKLILENGSKYVKKGGHIVYSTCTFTKIENEDVINNFLENNKSFELVDPINRISPLDFNSDGFTISKLKRND